jgi:uncharacterized hydrophobic protein (TIGR00271 family)
MIAAFGLVMNSTAVVIGAMLVAPLMTPILGLALGLVRGNAHLLGTAGRAETIGVAVSILAGAMLGWLLPDQFEPTQEMLSRTQPNLFDLLVAVFAGLAGAYALVEEKLSPVLPGVAISTAIVPPLANCGLCLSLGAYSGASGSFLLFFTNFLSILLVSSLVFSAAGMSARLKLRSGVTLVRRFGIAVVGFVSILVILAGNLLEMFEYRHLKLSVKEMLEAEFVNLRIHSLQQLLLEKKHDELIVGIDVQAPEVIGPRQVARLEQSLSSATAMPTRLYVRTSLTHTVSARGSTGQAFEHTLDGIARAGRGDQLNQTMVTAEQIIREFMEERRGLRLERLGLFPVEGRILLMADTSGPRSLSSDEILELRQTINGRIKTDKPVELVINAELSELRDERGALRVEFTLPLALAAAEQELHDGIAQYARDWLRERSVWTDGWSMTVLDEQLHLLLETRAGRLLNEQQRLSLNRELERYFDIPLQLYVRSRLDTVLGPEGERALPELLMEYRDRNRETYGEQIRDTIIKSR